VKGRVQGRSRVEVESEEATAGGAQVPLVLVEPGGQQGGEGAIPQQPRLGCNQAFWDGARVQPSHDNGQQTEGERDEEWRSW
jgi:hypothetical protein